MPLECVTSFFSLCWAGRDSGTVCFFWVSFHENSTLLCCWDCSMVPPLLRVRLLSSWSRCLLLGCFECWRPPQTAKGSFFPHFRFPPCSIVVSCSLVSPVVLTSFIRTFSPFLFVSAFWNGLPPIFLGSTLDSFVRIADLFGLPSTLARTFTSPHLESLLFENCSEFISSFPFHSCDTSRELVCWVILLLRPSLCLTF